MKPLSIFAALLFFAVVPWRGGSAWAAEKVVLQLRWGHQFQFAGYYAALWQGYYREAGLDVVLQSGVSHDGKIRVGEDELVAGRADFGIGGADILLARDRGLPLVVCATIFQHSATEFYALKSTGLHSPADLVNRKVARKADGLTDVELKAMLLFEGVDPAAVPPYAQRPGLQQLLAGDVVAGYSIEIPYHARRLGLELSRLCPADYGVDFYGDTLFTSSALLRQHPDRVARFVAASLRGWEYALAHPLAIADRIAETFTPAYPVDDFQKFNRFQIEPVTALTLYPVVRLGHTNPYRWARMHAALRELGLIRGEFDADSLIFDPEKLEVQTAQTNVRYLRWALWGGGFAVGGILAALVRLAVNQALLRRREQRLQAIFNAVPEGVFLFERSGALAFVNQTGALMFGCDAAELMAAVPFIPPLEDVGRQGRCGPLEWRLHRRDGGEPFDAEAYLRAFALDDREVVLVALRDVTVRKSLERTLQENERLLQVIFDEAYQFMGLMSPDGRLLRVNRPAAEFVQLGQDDLLGQPFWETPWWTHSPDLQEVLRGAIVRAEAGEFVRFETSHYAPDGAMIDVDFSIKPVKDAAGKVVLLIPEGRDITERKKIERDLHHKERRLRAILHNVAAGIAVLSPAGTYQEVNERWAQMLGYAPHEIVGRTFPEMTYADDLPGSRQMFEGLIAGAYPNYRLEKRYQRKDGSVFWADLSVTFIPDERGDVESAVGVFIDISRQKAIEEKLREANRELEGFVYTVSHDLRTPLAPIIGYAEHLAELCRDRLSPEELEYLGEIAAQGEKMLALMENLLALARVGRVERPLQATDVGAVVAEVLKNLAQKEGWLPVWVTAPLPSVCLEPTLVEEIFANLLGNALRYGGRGGLAVEVGGEERGAKVAYFVRDHGPGIPQEEKEQVFELFYRGFTGRRLSGTGVGLAIVQKIARLFGGRAWVEDTPGGGATFWVEMERG